MRGNVTVQQAISKGKIKLIVLPMFLIISFFFLGIYIHTLGYLEGWIIGIGAVSGFILGWLAWSYFVVDWKIWAFENVRNVHELKRKAIQNNLIWEDGNWFNKTEIINYEQKQKLKQLEKKFLENDVYYDDISLPKETIINFSKATIAFGIVFGIAAIGFPIYNYIDGDKNYFYLIFIGLGLFFLIKSVQKITAKEPPIILNAQGIKLPKTDFMEWQNIRGEFLEARRSGKHVHNYLVFYYKNQHQEIQIDDLDTNTEKLEKLLQVYRVRFKKKYPSE
jgi:hypothetical protein